MFSSLPFKNIVYPFTHRYTSELGLLSTENLKKNILNRAEFRTPPRNLHDNYQIILKESFILFRSFDICSLNFVREKDGSYSVKRLFEIHFKHS